MYILAIDTSTATASVAVAAGEQIITEMAVARQRTHSIILLEMIERVIALAGIREEALRGLAVTIGPGSFTGLRVGLAVAKALAQVWSLPVVAVSTLEAMAFPYCRAGLEVLALLQARRDEIYGALYAPLPVGENEMRTVVGPQVRSLGEVRKLLEPGRKYLAVGDGCHLLMDVIAQWRQEGLELRLLPTVVPGAANVAVVGYYYLLAGRGMAPEMVVPLYLKPAPGEDKVAGERHD